MDKFTTTNFVPDKSSTQISSPISGVFSDVLLSESELLLSLALSLRLSNSSCNLSVGLPNFFFKFISFFIHNISKDARLSFLACSVMKSSKFILFFDLLTLQANMH